VTDTHLALRAFGIKFSFVYFGHLIFKFCTFSL
jgi:hypothetical protein